MVRDDALIIEIAEGTALERSLRADFAERPEVVIVGLAPEAPGDLVVPQAGQVVLSVPSPEALAAEPNEIRRIIDRAGGGTEPLVIAVEEAESLREEELRPLLDATRDARRSVILRVMRTPDG